VRNRVGLFCVYDTLSSANALPAQAV
jgi:hypothetical protein